MYNINKNSWNIFLEASNKKNYCIIMVEQRTGSGDLLNPQIIEEKKEACDRFLQASYIVHHIEIVFHRIVCFLNYNQTQFSVSTFAASLSQLLFNMGNSSPSYVFYSEAFLSPEALEKEFIFIFDHSYYSIMVGKHQPISANLLHACHDNKEHLDLSAFHEALEDLTCHSSESMLQFFMNQSKYFQSMFDSGDSYSFSELLHYISEIYYGIRIFLNDRQYYSTSVDAPLWDLLVQTDGIVNLFLLLHETIKKYSAVFFEEGNTGKSSLQVNEMIDYINSHISSISLSSLSNYFNLTPSYICRIFKQTQNINFTEFVKKKRFQLAVEALQTDRNITISELSKQLGYKSQSYFQNTFKATFGLTPDAYRKQYHKQHITSDSE